MKSTIVAATRLQVKAAAVYELARLLDAPFPTTTTALAYAEAKLAADEIIDHHRHRRDRDEANHTCAKCVVIRNLLVDAKLRTQGCGSAATRLLADIVSARRSASNARRA